MLKLKSLNHFDLVVDIQQIPLSSNPGLKPLQTHNVITLKRETDSVSNPGWKNKLGKINATTPYIVESTKVKVAVPLIADCRITVTPSSFWVPNSRFYTNGYPLITGVLGTAPPNTTKPLATARMINDIRDASRSFSGGVFIGELDETLTLLVNPIKGFRSALGDYLKTTRKLRDKNRLSLKILSDLWLQFQFGVAPFINDIDDIMNYKLDRLLDKQIHRLSQRYIVDSVIRDTVTRSRPTGSELGVELTVHEFAKQACFIKVGYKPTPIENRATSLGLGFQDFVPTLYELIPGSFVVDYFTNMNGIINFLTTNTSNVTYVSVTETTTQTQENSLLPILDGFVSPNFKAYVANQQQGSFILERYSMNRTTTLAVPPLIFKAPNLKQAKNLIALITSLTI